MCSVLWSDRDGCVYFAEGDSGIEEMFELPKVWCGDCKFHGYVQVVWVGEADLIVLR